MEDLQAFVSRARESLLSPCLDFPKLYAWGVDVLDLSPEDEASMFSVSRLTSARWKAGVSGPGLLFQQHIISRLAAIAQNRTVDPNK